MEYKQILGKIKKACEDYNLIENGDKIAVGVSGGKDSLTLLYCLANLRKFYDKKFDIVAISIDMFSGDTDYSQISDFCKNLDVEYHIVKTNIKRIVFDIKKHPHPCSLCANLRRGFLNKTAKELGCNKVALGHNADDLIETFFMSLLHESRLNTFLPIMKLTNNTLFVIRPMILVYEKEIIEFSQNMPVVANPCPANKHTEREEIKQMIQNLKQRIPNAHQKVLSALLHPERNYLFDKLDMPNKKQKD